MAYSITIKFNDTAKTYAKEYIYASVNPGEIEAGGSATLVFKADGQYFQLYKASSKALTVTGAVITSWSCTTPYAEGTLLISNPTDNVVITLNPRQMMTPMELSAGFRFNTNALVDTRLVLSKAQMLQINLDYQPNQFFALCTDDNKLYIYDVNYTATTETGKFKLYEAPVDQSDVALKLPGAIATAMQQEGGAEEILDAMFNTEHFQTTVDNKIELAISLIQAVESN